MLAGISMTCARRWRMRLEIELSGVSEDARQAIDEDLGQIDHSIGQLMEYARPAGTLPNWRRTFPPCWPNSTSASAAIPPR